jgi:hypothetical protein
MHLKELGELKKKDMIGIRTRDLPACIIVPPCNFKLTFPNLFFFRSPPCLLSQAKDKLVSNSALHLEILMMPYTTLPTLPSILLLLLLLLLRLYTPLLDLTAFSVS